MLSVLIETRNDEEALARTLASLVGGAVEGLVREVIVCDLGSSDGTHRVAEHAGCVYLADGGVSAGMRRAKGEWLLMLEPGARLLDGWMEAVIVHTGGTKDAARFTRSRQSRPPLLRRVFSRRRSLADGLLITKRQALSLAADKGTAAAMAGAISARRLLAEIAAAQPAGQNRSV